MHVMSVINYKGGVGKTTLTANISAELAFRGQKVLVIDLDPQANLTFSFINVKQWQDLDMKGKTIKHWYDDYLDNDTTNVNLGSLIIKPARINQQLETYQTEGTVDLIASHLELINVDLELATGLSGATERTIRSSYLRLLSRLKVHLNDLANIYDIIIIDCPPNFNIVTQNAIVASTLCLIPAKPDYLSTLGIDQLLRHVNDLKDKYNRYVGDSPALGYETINPEILGVIFTMVSIYAGQPIAAQRDYIAQVHRSGTNVFVSFARENKTIV